MKEYHRICPVCGCEFIAHRIDNTCCSKSCYDAEYYKNHRAERAEHKTEYRKNHRAEIAEYHKNHRSEIADIYIRILLPKQLKHDPGAVELKRQVIMNHRLIKQFKKQCHENNINLTAIQRDIRSGADQPQKLNATEH